MKKGDKRYIELNIICTKRIDRITIAIGNIHHKSIVKVNNKIHA